MTSSVHTKGPDSIIRPIKNKVRQKVKERRINLQEFCRTFDAHGTKRITKEQFARALSIAGLNLTQSEIALLCERYEASDAEKRYVNYMTFCTQIEKVFTIKGLEKTPTKEVKLSVVEIPRNSYGLNNPNLTENERIVLSQLLISISFKVSAERLSVKSFFHDFDRHNNGSVTLSQFHRNIFVLYPDATPDDADLIAKAYTSPYGGVNYRGLHLDTTKNEPTPEQTPLHVIQKNTVTDSTNDICDELEKRCSRYVVQNRLRLMDYFQGFDKFKTQKISLNQFSQAFTRCFNLPISGKQITALGDRYLDCGKVNYKNFCDKLEKLSESAFSSATALDTNHLTAKEKTDLTDLMSTMQKAVTRRRSLMKPLFNDFDSRREGHVTTDQFLRVLSMFDLLPSSKSKIDLLVKAYVPTDGRHVPGLFVNYVRFMADVDISIAKLADKDTCDKSVKTRSLAFFPDIEDKPTIGAGKFASAPPTSKIFLGYKDRSMDVLMRDIKKNVMINRIRLHDVFSDQDRLKKGHISREQFARGLSISGNRASDTELEPFYKKYAYPFVCDALKRPFVTWTGFVDEIDRVFGLKGLESNPTLDVNACVTAVRLSANNAEHFTKEVELTPEEDEKVTAALTTIAAEINKRRIDPCPPFQDYDWSHRGIISKNHFERTLSSMNMLPAKEVADLLGIKFRENCSDKRPDINYRAFLTALDRVKSGTFVSKGFNTNEYRAELRDIGIPLPQEVKLHHKKALAAGPEVDLEHLLQKIRNYIFPRRIRLHEFLADGDRWRCGEITRAKFRGALSNGNVFLNESEIALLEKTYQHSSKPDLIAYRLFNAAIGEEYSIVRAVPGSGGNVDKEELNKILEYVKSKVTRSRIYLKPYFKDYDRNNNRQVTPAQFYSVLNTVGIELTDIQRETLKNGFVVQDEHRNRLNYGDFVKRVDPVEQF